MNAISDLYKNRKINFKKLIKYGFIKRKENYILSKSLNDCNFIINITISLEGIISAIIIEPDFNEPYTLHLVEGATGSFVSNIKVQYKQILKDIIDKCCDIDVFKTKMSEKLISYVRKKYNDELEFLWEKSPNNAIWRRKDNNKWYGTILTVSKEKLGIKSNEIVEIINLRVLSEELIKLIDNKKYFLGYHMNKKNWCSIILDGSVSYEEICQKIDNSYFLVGKHK